MKAYWIAHVDITDPDHYSQYTQRAPKAFAKFGAKFLARAGAAKRWKAGRRPSAAW